jgi:hypothetical protein
MLDHEPIRRRSMVRDDIAYILPMGVFLSLTWLSGELSPRWPVAYPLLYVIKTFLTATTLFLMWPSYTAIRWNRWWLGLVVGVIGIFQWVGMQLLLQRYVPFFRPSPGWFDPTAFFVHAGAREAFIGIRILDAVLVVPVMEELFWRDFLWRSVLAPNDFKLASVGEWDWKALLIVSVAFAFVHGNWGLTAIVWALLVGLLLVYTKSLGACIVAHGTTNLLLAICVLHTHDWSFW